MTRHSHPRQPSRQIRKRLALSCTRFLTVYNISPKFNFIQSLSIRRHFGKSARRIYVAKTTLSNIRELISGSRLASSHISIFERILLEIFYLQRNLAAGIATILPTHHPTHHCTCSSSYSSFYMLTYLHVSLSTQLSTRSSTHRSARFKTCFKTCFMRCAICSKSLLVISFSLNSLSSSQLVKLIELTTRLKVERARMGQILV